MYISEEYNSGYYTEELEGVAIYLESLIQRAILYGDKVNVTWPVQYQRLFKLYKKAGRDFLRFLYAEARNWIPWRELEDLAVPALAGQRDEVWDVLLAPGDGAAQACLIMVDAATMRFSSRPVPPEMIFALQTAVSARMLFDAFSQEFRQTRPDYYRADSIGRAHSLWADMLAKCLKILLPDYEKWHDNATASLAAICDEMLRISIEG